MVDLTSNNAGIMLSSSDAAVSVAQNGQRATVTFDSNNWDTAQMVTVTGVGDDAINASPRTATITHEVRERTEENLNINYDGYSDSNNQVMVDNVMVAITDSDQPEIAVSQPILTIPETDTNTGMPGTTTYDVSLSTRPTSNVTVTLARMGADPEAVTVWNQMRSRSPRTGARCATALC